MDRSSSLHTSGAKVRGIHGETQAGHWHSTWPMTSLQASNAPTQTLAPRQSQSAGPQPWASTQWELWVKALFTTQVTSAPVQTPQFVTASHSIALRHWHV
jgi:hypothetical protein